MTKRALNEEQKAARRASILQQTSALLASRDYSSITLVEIAKALGLVKGTLYLYFATKEELFLSVLEDELGRWFAEVRTMLDANEMVDARKLEQTLAQLCATIARSLEQRPVLVKLFIILNVELEKDLSEQRLRSFKTNTITMLKEAALSLERFLPFLKGQGQFFFLALHALAIGSGHLSNHSPAALRVLSDPHLAAFKLDFGQILESVLYLLLQGMYAQSEAASTFVDR